MKVGIITHYFKSTNYGGNLQAYALVEFLKEHGYDAEQICYERSNDYIFGYNRPIENKLLKMIKVMINLVRKHNIRKRERSIQGFNQSCIPHSINVYTKETIRNVENQYDVLISGSDQVWHPQAVCDAYLLNFPTKAKRISYAASFAVDELEPEVMEYYRPCLKKYSAISVREKEGQDLVQSICKKESELVLDPTLLLSNDTWEKFLVERKISEPYILCYFLGLDETYRDLANEYAKSKGLAIVTFPFLNGKNDVDKRFGKYKLFDVTPEQLLYLIKHSQYVFTDSFHVTVFSIIFNKEFFTFDRNGMGSRIRTLTEIFNISERYCDTLEKKTLDYISSLLYSKYTTEKLEILRKDSIDFLLNAIET